MDGDQKSKRLYIVRHGETDFNKNGMVQGRGINASLNDHGRKQAKAFYKEFRNKSFEKAYTSTLVRTEESIADFLEDGLEYEKLDGLDEISWGSQEGVKFSVESKNLYLRTVQQWREGMLSMSVAGGESPLEVAQRQKQAFNYIMDQPEQEVLICMHGRAMRILMTWLLQYDLSHMDHFPHSNLGLYQLYSTGNSFQIDLVNDTRHLKNI